MSGCGKIKELISPYLDGELEGSLREEVRKHLVDCSSCREILEIYRKLGDEASRIPLPDESTVEKSLEDAKRKLGLNEERSTSAFLKPALGLGVLALLVLAIYSGIPGLRSPEKASPPPATPLQITASEISEDELELLMLIDEAGGSEDEFLEILKTLEDLEEILESDRREA